MGHKANSERVIVRLWYGTRLSCWVGLENGRSHRSFNFSIKPPRVYRGLTRLSQAAINREYHAAYRKPVGFIKCSSLT